MTIPIKQIILEGSLNQVIEEMAVHANSYSFNKNTARYNPVIQNNRDILAHNIRLDRLQRDKLRNESNPMIRFLGKGAANSFDNGARLKSQDDRFGKELMMNTHPTGLIEKDIPHSKEFQNDSSVIPIIKSMMNPRIIASAKQ